MFYNADVVLSAGLADSSMMPAHFGPSRLPAEKISPEKKVRAFTISTPSVSTPIPLFSSLFLRDCQQCITDCIFSIIWQLEKVRLKKELKADTSKMLKCSRVKAFWNYPVLVQTNDVCAIAKLLHLSFCRPASLQQLVFDSIFSCNFFQPPDTPHHPLPHGLAHVWEEEGAVDCVSSRTYIQVERVFTLQPSSPSLSLSLIAVFFTLTCIWRAHSYSIKYVDFFHACVLQLVSWTCIRP